MPAPKVSLIATCMGRLHHIRHTLPRNIESNRDYPNVEFVLLDYNSRDGLEEWVSTYCRRYIDTGILRYFRTTEPKFWHHAHAKNVAHLCATGDILVNVDGDNYTGDGFAAHVARKMNRVKCVLRCHHDGDNGTMGRIALPKATFEQVGGYDEAMVGWGLEDGDLVNRAKRSGLPKLRLYKPYCHCILHGDQEREKLQTPPGEQKSLTKKVSWEITRAQYNKHNLDGTIVVNTDRVWGKAMVMRNFRSTFEVGSHKLSIPAFQNPPETSVINVPAPTHREVRTPLFSNLIPVKPQDVPAKTSTAAKAKPMTIPRQQDQRPKLF